MLTGYMLYSMVILLAVIGLDILAGIYRSLVTNTFSFEKLANFLKHGILYYVLPLSVLAYLSGMGMLSWLMLTMYYVGFVGGVIKYIMDIMHKLKA